MKKKMKLKHTLKLVTLALMQLKFSRDFIKIKDTFPGFQEYYSDM